MLLTAGQVSVLFSSGIIIIFTILLFLTGYTLQRQSVDALSAGIKPRVLHLAAQVQKMSSSSTPLPLAEDIQPQIQMQGLGRKRLAGEKTPGEKDMRWVRVGDAWRLISVAEAVDEVQASIKDADIDSEEEVISFETLRRLNGPQAVYESGSRLWRRNLRDSSTESGEDSELMGLSDA